METTRTCSIGQESSFAKRIQLALSWLILSILLCIIIVEPDPGGIWDGYVPTWLGGEGAPSAQP